MSKYDMDNKLSLSRKRNRAGESATLKCKRPDLCITTATALFKGEHKRSEEHLLKAIHDLGNKCPSGKIHFTTRYNTTVYSCVFALQCASRLSVWSCFPAVTGGISLVCYACAGSVLQFCVVPRDGNIPRTLGRPFSMAVQADQLCIIAVAIQVYQVVKAQRRQLPDHFLPLGCQQSTMAGVMGINSESTP